MCEGLLTRRAPCGPGKFGTAGHHPTEPFGLQSEMTSIVESGPPRRSMNAQHLNRSAGRSTPRRRLRVSRREAVDRLLRLQFAIIVAPGKLRPCRGENYGPVFGLRLADRTRMVCICRKTS